MQYKPVSWSVGEPFNPDKIKQMTENDEIIQNLYLQTALGTIAQDVYFDVEGGSSLSATPGNWTTVITLSDVFLYPSRWIKISFIAHGVKAEDRGTYIPFRVTMDGTEVLWARTPDAAVGAVQQYCSVSGARIMQSVPGEHDFVLQFGNDYAAAVNDTLILPVGFENPSILSIDDMGGLNV